MQTKDQITYEDFEKVDILMTLTGGFLFAFRQFIGNICKKYYYQNQSCGYLDICIYIPKIIHFSNFLSIQTVNNKNSIAKKILEINIKKSCKFLGKEIFGLINAVANQAADMLMDNPENDLSQGRYFFLTI